LNPAAPEFYMPSAAETYMMFPVMAPMMPMNPQACVFQPAPEPVSEVSMMLATTKVALLASPHVTAAEVSEGPPGATTTIVIEVLPEAKPQEILSLAKGALLDAAACSKNTYVMGYNKKPFTDISDDGFKASIVVDPGQTDVCWDLYQFGFCSCSRKAMARWYHPSEQDSMMLRVNLKRSAPVFDKPACAESDCL